MMPLHHPNYNGLLSVYYTITDNGGKALTEPVTIILIPECGIKYASNVKMMSKNSWKSDNSHLEAQIRAIMPALHICNQVMDFINPKIGESEDEHVHVQSLQNKNTLKMQQGRLLQFYTCLQLYQCTRYPTQLRFCWVKRIN